MALEKIEDTNLLQNEDIICPEFYENVQKVLAYNLAILKKNVSSVINLRMAAAEMEVETAALYHAQLWYNIEDLKLSHEERK